MLLENSAPLPHCFYVHISPEIQSDILLLLVYAANISIMFGKYKKKWKISKKSYLILHIKQRGNLNNILIKSTYSLCIPYKSATYPWTHEPCVPTGGWKRPLLAGALRWHIHDTRVGTEVNSYRKGLLRVIN